MARFAIKMNCDNAAFEDTPLSEVCRILREIAQKTENGQDAGTIFDINGNEIGEWYYDA